MSEVTVVRTPQEFLAELKKLNDAKVATPPLTGSQIEAKIGEMSLALESTTLAPEMRKHIEAARADLIRQQFILVHGHLFDENGEKPVDEKAIAAKVIETISESLQSEPLDADAEEEGDLAEQEKALNAIDEADAVSAVVSGKTPATISAPTESQQMPQAVVLSPKDVMILRASLRANLMHVVIHVLSQALQEK